MRSRSWLAAGAGCPSQRQWREISPFRPTPKGSALVGHRALHPIAKSAPRGTKEWTVKFFIPGSDWDKSGHSWRILPALSEGIGASGRAVVRGGDSAPCALLVRCKTVVARSSGVLLISTKIGREAGVGSAPALICDAAEHPKRVGSARSGPVWLVLRRIWLRSPGTARASRLLLQLLCCLRLRSCLLIAPKNACPFLPFPAMVRSVPT